ncbi:MAG: hypothetical protein V4760_15380 [Bdellovibrionota bacterium]
MSRFELFHKIANVDCAAIRRRISEMGLKSLFDFRNVDTGDTASGDLASRGGSLEAVPIVWDGTKLITGRNDIEIFLTTLANRI